MWGNAFIKKIKRTSNLLEIIPKPQKDDDDVT